MCGIAGWLSPDGTIASSVLDGIRDAMAHRGPDGAGTWVSSDRRVGLAHRRLSIIDLSDAASQPMRTERDGRALSIVFNGEIYNHADLRAELEALGHAFRTDHSDTEVLLVGAHAWGVDGLLPRLNGAFAFALFDERAGRVTLVRDRIGIKPLYVAALGRDLLFASEAKALFQHPRLEPALDRESFPHYLSFRSVAAPRTLFEGVECLAPAERMDVDVTTGRRTRTTWWDPLDAARTPPATLDAARDELAWLLQDSLDARLVSDVPVGLFLSGGVDSTYLLRLLAKRRDGAKTFTVTYPGHAAYDEGDDARHWAKTSGTDHHEVPLDAATYGDALEAVAWHQDEPIAAPVCTSVYFLAKAAREAGVPVVLAGEGSDELFIGYENWIRMRDAERWNGRFPDLPGRALRRTATALAAKRLSAFSPHLEVLRRASAGQPLFQGGSLDFGEAAKGRLLGPGATRGGASTYDAVIAPLRAAFEARADARDLTAWMTYVDLRFRLPQLMLPRLDKMGMAFSVEGRVPFLDHRVVEFVLGLPPAWRGAVGREGKALFKDVAERELPTEFVRRRKRGFRAPVAEWKEGEFGRQRALELQAFAERTELFEPAALRSLLARTGDRLYFSLVNFMVWYRLYVDDVLADERDAAPIQPRRRELVLS
ncbi:MAG: asparagine synthase (glutamine-hydrolyzing) [Planctomycetota bacterium]